MKNVRTAVASCLVLFTVNYLAIAQIAQDEVRMSTPTSPWTLVVTGKAVALTNVGIKGTPESAYFLLYDSANELSVSFYIEPVDKCKSSDECRDYVLNLGNPAWGKYQGLAKGKVADFSYFEFYRPEIQGRPMQMQDMYAQYVDKGYWIDLHISKVLYKKEQHKLFEDVVKSVKFVAKDAPIDQLSARVEKASTAWLAVWDSGRCRETYGSMSPISRKEVTVDRWLEYCRDGQAVRGKVKERKPIATSVIKSIEGAPGVSGAQIYHRTVFEKSGPKVELVTFVLETDGTWTIANYVIL